MALNRVPRVFRISGIPCTRRKMVTLLVEAVRHSACLVSFNYEGARVPWRIRFQPNLCGCQNTLAVNLTGVIKMHHTCLRSRTSVPHRILTSDLVPYRITETRRWVMLQTNSVSVTHAAWQRPPPPHMAFIFWHHFDGFEAHPCLVHTLDRVAPLRLFRPLSCGCFRESMKIFFDFLLSARVLWIFSIFKGK